MTDADRTGTERKRLIAAAIFVLVAAALLFGIGLSVSNALLLAAAAAIAYGMRRFPFTDVPRWPPRLDDRTDQGARREVARLSWNLQGFEQRVERSSVRRLRRIAERRLAERGLHLGEPADAQGCRARLPEPAYTILTGPEASTRPTLAEFTRAVTIVELVSGPDVPAGTPR